MTFTFEEDIQNVLDEHRIKFKAEELQIFSREERLSILIRSFRAVNILDSFLIFLVFAVLFETRFELNWFNLIAAVAMGYSAWRFQNYATAARKLKRLYHRA